MEIVKESYENFIRRENESIDLPLALEKQKVLFKMKEVGYVNTLVLSLIVIFVLGIAVGIGYMLFNFGV